MRFKYKAKKGLDSIIEGTIDAKSQEEALDRLMAQGVFPIAIEVVTVESYGEGTSEQPKAKRKIRSRINSRQIFVFTQKLTTLVRAQVALLQALNIVYEQTENVAFQEVILEIYNAIKEGQSLSEALSRFPKLFSTLYVNIVRSGEASGAMASALEQILEFSSKKEALKNKVVVALAYPVLLIFVGMMSIFVLITFVIPKLRPILMGPGVELPLITKIILKISMFSNQSWVFGLGAIAVGAVLIYKQKDNPVLKDISRGIKTKLPIIKRMLLNQELTYFAHSLGLLLKRGVPALRALEVVIPGLSDYKLKEELKGVLARVSAGQSMSRSMSELTGLPDFFTKMIAVGEESGRLAEVLGEISESYAQQVDSDVALVSSLLEPVLILVLGVVLGSIVLSILVPVFQMTQTVSG
ncbi:MAG: type II secretion system F family protein [PVC group bacterium]|nr:type II secretion system F family protein [PVC group bacterium]